MVDDAQNPAATAPSRDFVIFFTKSIQYTDLGTAI